MRIFEITDFIDRASDITKAGQPNKVVDLANEIKKAGDKVINQVKILLTTASSAKPAVTQPAAQPAAAPAPTAQPTAAPAQPAAKP